MRWKYSFFWNKIKLKIIKWPSRKWKMAIKKTELRFSRMILQFRWNFCIFFKKKAKRSPEIAISVKKYEICIFGGSFCFFCLIILVKWERMVAILLEKIPINYQKILEKCKMSFCSSENKNWTFRGSFDKFSAFFCDFARFICEFQQLFFITNFFQRRRNRELTSVYRCIYHELIIIKTRNNEWGE